MTTRRELMRSTWATAASVAALTPLVLAACGAQTGQAPAPAARRDVTLEWLAGANATEEQIFRQIATSFEAANAPNKVSFLNGNAFDGGWQVKLETMAAASTPPDVAWHGPE